MSLEDLLEKDSLTSEEKNRLIELICEKEKKFEGITFGVINMPKKKYKLFKRKKDSDVLGIQVTTIKDGVPTFNVAITEEETPLVVFLNTIYHEIEHVKQKDKLLTARYPLSINMILTKEFLASLNKVYYKSNYNKLVTEINARLMGRKKTEWLIKDKDSSNSLGVRNYIDENLKRVYILDDDIGEISLSEKTDKFVLSHVDEIDNYPSLAFEYNKNGKRKSIKELYMVEPYYLKGKNDMLVNLIVEAFNELYFINVILGDYDYNSLSDDELRARLEEVVKNIRIELEHTDGRLEYQLDEVEVKEKIVKNESDAIIDLIYLMPTGLRHKSDLLNGLTTASENIGIVSVDNHIFKLEISMRGALESYIRDMANELFTLGKVMGFETRDDNWYPAWDYMEHSHVRDMMCEAYKEATGKDMVLEGIHAGLECGIFKNKFPEMDIVAIGPNILDCHSPSERIEIASFDRSYEFLKVLLSKL